MLRNGTESCGSPSRGSHRESFFKLPKITRKFYPMPPFKPFQGSNKFKGPPGARNAKKDFSFEIFQQASGTPGHHKFQWTDRRPQSSYRVTFKFVGTNVKFPRASTNFIHSFWLWIFQNEGPNFRPRTSTRFQYWNIHWVTHQGIDGALSRQIWGQPFGRPNFCQNP